MTTSFAVPKPSAAAAGSTERAIRFLTGRAIARSSSIGRFPGVTALARGLLLLLAFSAASVHAATTYYSQTSGDPTTLANWNTTRAGGGTSPANFTSGDIFVIQNTHTMTATTTWTVSGTGNKIQVESGGVLSAGDGTTSSSSALITYTTFQIDNGGSYIVNYKHGTSGSSASIPGTTRTFGASSTVEIKLWGDGTGSTPAALPSGVSWGNLKINVPTLAGSWQQSGAITTVQGDLIVVATGGTTREFRLDANVPASFTLNVSGNIQVSGGILNLTSGRACRPLTSPVSLS